MYMPPPPPKRKIMGMTIPQIAILAALAVGNLLVIVIGLIILSSLSRSTANDLDAAAIPTLYVMPPTATPGATITPTPIPTPTPWPTVTPIPGWKQIVGQGVSLWLPEEYDGGNPMTEMDALMQRYIAAGAEPNSAVDDARTMQENQAVLLAFARPEGNTVRFLHLVIATSKEVSAQTTLDSYLGNNLPGILGSEFRLVGREDIALNELPATRLAVERRFQDTAGESFYKEYALYFFKVGERMWRLEYSCDRTLFAQNLPIFDQSARSFTVSADASFATQPNTGPVPTSISTPVNAGGAPGSTDGWVTFESSKVSIMLPPDFDGGDMTQDAAAILKRFGQELPGLSVEVLFFTRDTATPKTFGYILRDTIPAGMTMEDVLQVVKDEYLSSMKLILQEDVSLDRYAAKRWIVEFPSGNLTGRMEMYFIQDGSDIWVIYYVYPPTRYETMQPILRLSANSFVIKQP